METSNSSEIDSLNTKRESSWPSVLFYIHLNILGFYGLIVLLTNTSFLTLIFTILLCIFAVVGVTAGSHRLWAHRTYKANTTLRILLMICQTIAGQGSIYNWVRAHRLHHEKFGTDDDIYYSNKDFLSAQVFTQIRSYSKKQEELLKKIDMEDIEQDKVVMFQKRFYWVLYFLLCVLLPINTPIEYWNDSIPAALFVAFSLRYWIVLNVCWLVNSAHFVWGLDKSSKPSDSNLIFIVTKSYWPFYHYLLPCDYQTGEFGDYGSDLTTDFIRVFAAMGWAQDLQTVTTEAVRKGLTQSVDEDRDPLDCIKEAASVENGNLPKHHYLNRGF